MAIRLSGINSGLDTDAIVKELVSAYSLKTQKYEKEQTKLSWKQETWKNLNTKIYNLYKEASNMRLSSAYSLRKTTVSNNTKASVTASSTAPTGTQKLNILATAQSGYITGGKLGDDVTKDTKMSDLGFTGSSADIEVRKNDGTTTKITVKKDTTVSEFINMLGDADLNASFDETNKRIFINSKKSGIENDFNLVGMDKNGQDLLKTLGIDVALTKAVTDADGNISYEFTNAGSTYKDAYAYYEKALKGGAYVQDTNGQYIYDESVSFDTDNSGTIDKNELQEYLKSQIAEYDRQQSIYDAAEGLSKIAKNTIQTLEEAKSAYTELEKNITSVYKEVTGSDNVGEEIVSAIMENMGTLVEDAEPVAGKLKSLLVDSSLLSEDKATEFEKKLYENPDFAYNATRINKYVTNGGSVDDDFDAEIAEQQKIYDEKSAKLKPAQDAMEALGVTDLIKIRDEEIKSLQEEAKKANGGNLPTNFEIKDEDLLRFNIALSELATTAVEANNIMTNASKYTEEHASATKIDATDAKIKLNGVEFTGASNTFTVNGLTIEAQEVTGDGEANAISITTSIDAQGIYDKIKDFLTEYNTVINEMTKLYNADSARDYEPLTDEEKEAMSEEQIEKWENKIKDSLLRRDTTLNSVMSAMVNSMATAFEIDGEKVSLSTFGISTLGFLNAPDNEHYAYHIDGDEDDPNTSEKEDELMTAIQEDPEKVMEFMQKLMSNLYTSIDNKMKSTELSSAYKVYNDKEMDKQYKEYSSIISEWEKRVSDREEYYYDKFSQMEVALAKLNSQTSSLSGLIGG